MTIEASLKPVPATAPKRRYCYRSGCGHPECRAEVNRMQKAIKARTEQGLSNKIPRDRALAVLEERRRELGGHASDSTVAKSLGLPYHVVHDLALGKSTYIERKSWDKLLGAPHRLEVPDKVASRATTLRLRALVAEGWRSRDLVAQVPCHPTLYTRYDLVAYKVAARVVDFLEAAGPGDSRRASVTALNKGWRPREAYDQDLLYDPLWDGVGGLLDPGRRPRAELVEEYWHLIHNDVDPAEAAHRVGKDRAWGREVYREAGRRVPDALFVLREVTA